MIGSTVDNSCIFIGERRNNIYVVQINEFSSMNIECLSVIDKDGWLWYRKLGYANMGLLFKLTKRDLVGGLSTIKYEKGKMCDACQFAKLVKSSFKLKDNVSTSRIFTTVLYSFYLDQWV